jgi:hypothetical protein
MNKLLLIITSIILLSSCENNNVDGRYVNESKKDTIIIKRLDDKNVTLQNKKILLTGIRIENIMTFDTGLSKVTAEFNKDKKEIIVRSLGKERTYKLIGQ